VELLKHYVAEASVHKRRFLLTTELSEEPFERLMTYFDLNIARMVDSGSPCNCLIVKLASEVATFSDDMRAVLADGVREWAGYLEKVILEGQSRGTIRKGIDAKVTALTIHDLWMGASQRMQVERGVAPLRAAMLFVRHYLSPA